MAAELGCTEEVAGYALNYLMQQLEGYPVSVVCHRAHPTGGAWRWAYSLDVVIG